MNVDLQSYELLAAEVARLRKENADLLAMTSTRFGLVWERDGLATEADINKAFVPDLVLEENNRPISMLEHNPGNVVIEGNNVNALKLLSRTHAGAFDCIFIDPPYGTGNTAWHYNDAFVNPKHRFKDSGWLTWMEPRLEYARDLLSPTGCLIVCIDDSKRAALDLMLEQIMPGRRIGSLVWRTRQGANDKGIKNLSADHEHLIVYGNTDFEFGGQPKSYSLYKYFDEGSTDPWRIGDLTVNVAWNEKRAGNGYYPIYDPLTDVWYPCSPNAVWRFGSENFQKAGKKNRKDTMEELIRKGRVIFPKGRRIHIWNTREELDSAIAEEDVPKNGKGVPLLRADLPNLDFFVGKKVGWGIPQFKRYKSELTSNNQPLSSWIRSTADRETVVDDDRALLTSGLNREGSSHLASLLGGKKFDYPKPVSLVTEILRQATSPDSLVLDFFAGSGTTAEAILRLNSEDQGTRRFVLVSNTEATPMQPDKNLCRDVCAERIRAIVNASGEDGSSFSESLRSGFAYLRLSSYSMLRRAEELTPSRLWTLILLRHGCPVRKWTPEDGYDLEKSSDGNYVSLIPTPLDMTIHRLNSLDLKLALTVYTPYPSRVRPLLKGKQVEVVDTATLEPFEMMP